VVPGRKLHGLIPERFASARDIMLIGAIISDLHEFRDAPLANVTPVNSQSILYAGGRAPMWAFLVRHGFPSIL
jgi:hypothetical protein